MFKYIILLLAFTSFAQDIPKYNRSDWGTRWIDADKDCQDTRQEVLIEESLIPVTFDSKGCKVISGRWICPFTGMIITNPILLDIDHMVPLKEAHISGGWKWSKKDKISYANDLSNPLHLIAVYRGANRSKGARTPNKWMPNYKPYHCLYLLD